MKRKSTLAFILAAALLLVVSTAVLAGNRGAAFQDMAAETATPVPLVTPVTSSGTIMDGMNVANCPMMGGTAGMGTTTGMGAMPQMSSPNMNNMGSMGSMGGTMMSGMNMQGTSNLPYMNDNYFVLSDPTTWLSSNPWILLGWIVLGLVVLALLAALGLVVFYIVHRIAQSRPAAKS